MFIYFRVFFFFKNFIFVIIILFSLMDQKWCYDVTWVLFGCWDIIVFFFSNLHFHRAHTHTPRAQGHLKKKSKSISKLFFLSWTISRFWFGLFSLKFPTKMLTYLLFRFPPNLAAYHTVQIVRSSGAFPPTNNLSVCLSKSVCRRNGVTLFGPCDTPRKSGNQTED